MARRCPSGARRALGVLGLAVGLSLGVVNLQFAILFLLVVYGWGLLFGIGALLLDELTSRRYEGLADRVLLACWALIEPLGYRKLTVVWQLRGMVRAARGRSDWGDMSRRGFLGGRSVVGSPGSLSDEQVQR